MNDDNIFAAGDDHPSTSRSTSADTATPREHLPLFARLFELLTVHFSTLLPVMAAIVVLGLVSIGIGLVAGVVQVGMSPEMATATSIVTNLLSLLIALGQTYLSLAFMQMLLALDRGQETSSDVLTEQGMHWLYAFGAYLLIALLAIPVVIVWALLVVPVPLALGFGLGFDDPTALLINGGVSSTWVVVMLSPLFYFTSAFGYAGVLVVDHDLNPVDAVTGSWEVTSGHRWFLVGQQWILLAAAIASYCLSCGMLMPLLPLIQIPLQIVTYNSILAHRD